MTCTPGRGALTRHARGVRAAVLLPTSPPQTAAAVRQAVAGAAKMGAAYFPR